MLTETIPTQFTAHAFKEWAVAVDALGRGETITLLRKGGIREEGRHFRVAHDAVLLYPTYEHQQPALLKPAYEAKVAPVAAGWHPTTVPIHTFAQITDIFQISEQSTVEGLLPFHIWNERFAAERFGWKPRHPLYVLLLRAYRLAAPAEIAFDPAYGGCTSWIDLRAPLSLAGMQPVLADDVYNAQVAAVRAVVDAAVALA